MEGENSFGCCRKVRGWLERGSSQSILKKRLLNLDFEALEVLLESVALFLGLVILWFLHWALGSALYYLCPKDLVLGAGNPMLGWWDCNLKGCLCVVVVVTQISSFDVFVFFCCRHVLILLFLSATKILWTLLTLLVVGLPLWIFGD